MCVPAMIRKETQTSVWHDTLKLNSTFLLITRTKGKTFWRKTLWSYGTKVELFVHNEQQYVWSRGGEAFHPTDTIPIYKHGAGSMMLFGCWLQVDLLL